MPDPRRRARFPIGYAQILVWEGGRDSGTGDVEGVEISREGARALLGLGHPPTEPVAINGMYALGAYAGVADLGLRVPDDISIVRFDDIAMANIANPPLTTIRQPLETMMRRAVNMLIDRLEGRMSLSRRSSPFRPTSSCVVPPRRREACDDAFLSYPSRDYPDLIARTGFGSFPCTVHPFFGATMQCVLFTKHFLGKSIAETGADLGFYGIDLLVRNGFQVTPDALEGIGPASACL